MRRQEGEQAALACFRSFELAAESIGKKREKDQCEDHDEVLHDEPGNRDASLLRLYQSSFPQCPQNDNRTCNR